MQRRQVVKDAIAHKATRRIPYCIQFTRKAREQFAQAVGCRSVEGFVDNDIVRVSPP